MIRTVVFGIALTALIAGYQIANLQQEISSPRVTTVPEKLPERAAPKLEAPAGNTSQPPAESSKTDAEVLKNVDPDPLLDEQMLAAGPWDENLNPPIVPARYLRQGLDVRALKIKSGYLSSLTPGDELNLLIPQLGQTYQMQVEQVGVHLNGDLSLKGHLTNTDLPYSVIMTEGARSTFATINTPEGAYMLEAKGENGWIMSLADIDYMIDPNLKDYLIPDITR